MLAVVGLRTRTGKRDYAILLLLVTYGLRGREVAALTFDDIDWRNERIRIRERKAGHSTAYPLSSILGQAIVDMQGRKVRFFTVKALVTHLLEMTEQRQLERTLRQLERQDLLILDEFGYVPFSKTAAELLFEVVIRAYERQSLAVTTNLPFES